MAALLACGAQSPEPPQVFVAFASDFQPYPTWTSFYVGDVPPVTGVDIAGPRTVYINELPPHGATEFPVGTILVKVVKPDASPADWQMFGMVKRGGGFDPQGAPNWEWFGLSTDPMTGRVLIDWRGTGPPPDGGYGSIGRVCSVTQTLRRTITCRRPSSNCHSSDH
jgi:hypothetical protein